MARASLLTKPGSSSQTYPSFLFSLARENKKEGYVWELDPGFVSKDALAIAFEGNGERTVMWRQKKVVEVRIPLRKPKEMK